MKKYYIFPVFMLLMLILIVDVGYAEVLTEDNMPSVNSEANLCNGGQIFTDGEYMYVSTTSNGYLCQLDNDLNSSEMIMDEVTSDARYALFGDWVYFVGRKNKGIYRLKLDDGDPVGNPERLVSGDILSYAINELGIYYAISGKAGIWRSNLDGSDRIKLCNHTIRVKNNVVRMMTYGDQLFYINDKDKCLYVINCDGSGDNRKICDKEMHYFVIGIYKGEPIVIYSKYADSNDKLNSSSLRVIDMNGERVEELDFIRDIKSRYINYMSGFLYYADSDDGRKLKRINLNAENPTPEMLLRKEVGYIHAFDGWVAALDMNGETRHFINLETLESYSVNP